MWTHVCPIWWAMWKPVVRPLSLTITAPLEGSHMLAIVDTPVNPQSSFVTQKSVLSEYNQPWKDFRSRAVINPFVFQSNVHVYVYTYMHIYNLVSNIARSWWFGWSSSPGFMSLCHSWNRFNVVSKFLLIPKFICYGVQSLFERFSLEKQTS